MSGAAVESPIEFVSAAERCDRQIQEVRRRQRKADYELAVLLVEMDDARHYAELGFARLVDYAAVRVGIGRDKTQDLLRLGRRVAELPATKAAMQAGDLDWTKARTMSKVLTPDNESAWLERARACRNRELEADVKAASPGDLPPEGPPAKGPARQRMTVDLEAVDLETIRQALALVRVHMGASAGEMEPGAALAAICRRFVESVDGDHAPTGEPYRILVEYCPGCGKTEGVDAEVSDTVQGEASCDAGGVQCSRAIDIAAWFRAADASSGSMSTT